MLFVLTLFINGCSNKTIENSETEYSNETKFINVETVEMVEISEIKLVEVDFAFPYLIWRDTTYEILLEQEINQSKLGVELGKVERYIPSSYIVKSGIGTSEKFEDSNGDSNLLRVGTKIYKIKWKRAENDIAVEYKGKYYKAKAKLMD